VKEEQNILIPEANAERVLELARRLAQKFKDCDIFNPAPLETDLTIEENSSVKIPEGWKFVLVREKQEEKMSIKEIIKKIKDWLECVKLDIVWFIEDVRHALKWIKWGWQRARRGYSDWDAGDFDEYLMQLIADVLKHYARDYYPDDEEHQKVKAEIERIIELCEHCDEPDGIFRDKKKRQELMDLIAKHIAHWWI